MNVVLLCSVNKVKQHNIMVGAIVGAAASIGSSIYGAIKSSQANKRAQQLIQNQREENQKWYDQKMAEDYTKRSDVQNLLTKQKELFQEQYKKARATNAVAGGTDEAAAMQQEAANKAAAETTANIAAQSSSYKEGVENQYREQDAALNQQQVAVEQGKAQNIAAAAGQVGSAVSGLMTGASTEKNTSKATPLTTEGLQLYADAQKHIADTLDEDMAKLDDDILRVKA